ncbi:MAG: four-carbon acid sugar kinase family protein [Alphaproteobacteria bacterium]|nr:MAG: four-carbon acid sugar kinase family protein [Alphaproteobacteria bacterium]
MSVLLGAIADDFTGATDLCNTLVRRGMRTVQLIDVPPPGADVADAEAVVIALKSRTIPAADAITKSLAALGWLQSAGAQQILFKYCSTFDSTDAGNIGPVAEALMAALDTDFTLFCPAFPEAGRTIYRGYLFVGDVLLSESGMRDHPLTPMRDPSLVRVLQRQSRGQVGLVPQYDVARGPAAIRDAFASLRQAGFRHAIVDAIEDHDLEAIGEAAADFKLITGGSGIALGLPENFRRRGLLGSGAAADRLPAIFGAAAVLSGSCSPATLTQVAYMRERAPLYTVDPIAIAEGRSVAEDALDWAKPLLGDRPILISATAPPETVAEVQRRLGRERAGALVEEALAAIARGLAANGVRRFVIAGGETAGAVVQGLGVTGLRIGRQIDPGVPWTASLGEPELALALKSGNFGAADFFLRAFSVLSEGATR